MTQRHAANVFWSGLEAAVSAVLAFASAFIVARLVGPAEVGIGAAAVAVHVLLWVAVNALFADALVQRSVVDDAAFSSAFTVSVAVGCLAAVLQAALGQPLAWSLGDSRLTAMSTALALPLPLVGAAGPVQGLLTRDRAYRKLALRTLIGQGFGTLAGIVNGALVVFLKLQPFIRYEFLKFTDDIINAARAQQRAGAGFNYYVYGQNFKFVPYYERIFPKNQPVTTEIKDFNRFVLEIQGSF